MQDFQQKHKLNFLQYVFRLTCGNDKEAGEYNYGKNFHVDDGFLRAIED